MDTYIYSIERLEICYFSFLTGSIQMVGSYIEVQGCKTYIQKSAKITDESKSILLLHGLAYSSKTWMELETLQLLKSNGFEPYAIDLPGHGNSSDCKHNQETFLKDVLDALAIENSIILSPSMSGRYSIPLLIDYQDKLKGYIPVAPVIPKEYIVRKDAFPETKVPSLIIYGEKDPMLKSQLKDILTSIPNSKLTIIPEARHPCYIDDPDLFHNKVLDFIKIL